MKKALLLIASILMASEAYASGCSDTAVNGQSPCGHIIKDSTGSTVRQRKNLQFTGAGVTSVVSATNTTVVTIGGGGIAVSDVPFSKGVTIPDPTASEDISLFYADDAITISKIVYVITGSTSATVTIRHSTDRSATGNEVVTSGTTADSTTTGNVVTSFNDATVPADSFVWLETTALSGTPTSLNATIFFTQDA